MQTTRSYVVSIAGFDPSAGAGVLADCKTFEQHGVYGFGICSAMTVQRDDAFISIQWLRAKQIINQLRPLTDKFVIAAAKIGIIASLEILRNVVAFLRAHNPSISIVWDPVLKASTGFSFHEQLQAIKGIDLITPNREEWERIGCPKGPGAVLVKDSKEGVDVLYIGEEQFVLQPGVNKVFPKHGSGCVLSAAIAACLAKGSSMQEACEAGKTYIEQFLNSNETLLGYHVR